MRKCPQCGGRVPPSGGRKPKTFCSEVCQRRRSEERRAVRRRLDEWIEKRERLAAGGLVLRNSGGYRESPETVERRIAELEAELVRLAT